MSDGNSRLLAFRDPSGLAVAAQASRGAPVSRQSRDVSGELLRKQELSGFTITEDRYHGGFTLPKHHHRKAFLTFVLEGSYVETYAGVSSVCGPGTLRFHPAGEVHENDFRSGLRCLHVEIEEEVLDRLREQALVLQRPAEITGVASTWLANRLYIEFCRRDSVSPMAMEGVILEILVEGARSTESIPEARSPRWLKRAREIVETRFLEPLSLADIATSVGVHHVHLSREFRKHNQCTVGELIRRRRVEHACHLLAHTEMTLAEIALVCGFSDQSHFSLMFKRQMGLTPSKFRDHTSPQ
jgi:AraC family transcriptional regulator